MWSLLLASTTTPTTTSSSASQPSLQRQIVQLPPEATVNDLYEAARQAFSGLTVSQLQRGAGLGKGVVVLQPSPSTTLVEAGLQSQDRILVTLVAAAVGEAETKSSGSSDIKNETRSNARQTTKKKRAAPSTKQATISKAKKSKKAGSNHDAEDGSEDYDASGDQEEEEDVEIASADSYTAATAAAAPRASKRKAAQKAIESFTDVIRQQDELAAAVAATRQRRSPAKTARPTKPKSNSTKFSALEAGRRLQDGAVVESPSRNSRRNRQTNQSSSRDTTDPGLALLQAVNGTDRGSRLMRAGWRQAVQDAVEQNKAVARLAAVQAGNYSISTSTSRSDGDLETPITQYHVRYSKGVQGRGDYTDTDVDVVPVEVLQSLVAGIHPVHPDALRPENLALLSPRVFWSLVAVQQEQQLQQQKCVDIGQALQQLQPDLDWSFLRRRKQQLSEKARENLRQQRMQSTTTTDWQAAADAIESVERAMGDLQALDRRQRQSRLAGAAAARYDYHVVTPSETDLDELLECIQTGGSIVSSCCIDTAKAQDPSTQENQLSSAAAKEVRILAQALIRDCHIHNWRELANCSAPDLVEKLKKNGLLSGWAMGEEQSTVQAWIDHAQLNSLDEIILEICQGNTDAVRLLRDVANSGTPKDLAYWRGISDLLHQELVTNIVNRSDQDETNSLALPSKEDLARWCDRAHQAVQQLEWLSWYATPIEG